MKSSPRETIPSIQNGSNILNHIWEIATQVNSILDHEDQRSLQDIQAWYIQIQKEIESLKSCSGSGQIPLNALKNLQYYDQEENLHQLPFRSRISSFLEQTTQHLPERVGINIKNHFFHKVLPAILMEIPPQQNEIQLQNFELPEIVDTFSKRYLVNPFKKSKMIEYLESLETFQISWEIKYDTIPIPTLKEIFSHLKNVKDLSLQNKEIFLTDETRLDIILSSFKNISSLRFNMQILKETVIEERKQNILKKNLPNVSILEINQWTLCFATPQQLENLVSCLPHLRHLTFYESDLSTELSLCLVKIIEKLNTLSFTPTAFSKLIYQKDPNLFHAFDYLQALHFANCENLVLQEMKGYLEILSNAHELINLDIWIQWLGKDSPDWIQDFFSQLPKLRHLSISQTYSLAWDKEKCQAFWNWCAHIHWLRFVWTWFMSISPENWKDLFTPMKKLEYLSIENMVITEADKTHSSEIHPEQIISLFQCIKQIKHLSLVTNLTIVPPHILKEAFSSLWNLHTLTLNKESAEYIEKHLDSFPAKILIM